mmetsp:Transcript_5760/g.10032  ORF Transcript_5760/g.10032 Transcript_5760/m.10032 type:complete len:425 (-) Transcript_5760:54-1328(-)
MAMTAPSHSEISRAVADLCRTVNPTSTTLKAFTQRLSESMDGVTVADLSSQKAFIRSCIQRELETRSGLEMVTRTSSDFDLESTSISSSSDEDDDDDDDLFDDEDDSDDEDDDDDDDLFDSDDDDDDDDDDVDTFSDETDSDDDDDNTYNNSIWGTQNAPAYANDVQPVDRLLRVDHPRCSEDLEQGRMIPGAAEYRWMDGYFDFDLEELIAVFDHDTNTMIWYELTKRMLTVMAPIAVVSLGFILLFTSTVVFNVDERACFLGYDSCQYITMKNLRLSALLIELVILGLSMYGNVRVVRSTVNAYHLAVVRDGVRTVHDRHISTKFGLLAAFPCFDRWLTVSNRTFTVPLDRILEITIPERDEIVDEEGMCSCCFRVPYSIAEIETVTLAKPIYVKQAMFGLKDPFSFQRLVGSIKDTMKGQV